MEGSCRENTQSALEGPNTLAPVVPVSSPLKTEKIFRSMNLHIQSTSVLPLDNLFCLFPHPWERCHRLRRHIRNEGCRLHLRTLILLHLLGKEIGQRSRVRRGWMVNYGLRADRYAQSVLKLARDSLNPDHFHVAVVPGIKQTVPAATTPLSSDRPNPDSSTPLIPTR